MSLSNMLFAIKRDAARYQRGWLRAPGFWLSLSYRVRRFRKLGGWSHQLLLPIDVTLGVVRRLISDSTLPSSVDIGPGLYLPHTNGIIVNDMVEIGADVSIFHQVTIGEWRGKAPKIEDSCVLFGGAKVFGGIVIGTASKIGANVVVSVDIPAYSTVSVVEPIVRIHTAT